MPRSHSERIVGPRLAPRAGVEPGRGLVEEDQIRIADQRECQVEPPKLAARQLAGRACRASRRARPTRSARRLGGGVRGSGRTSRSTRSPSDRSALRTAGARSRHARATRAARAPDPCPALLLHREFASGTPRGSRRWMSCPPRSAQADRTPHPERLRSSPRARPQPRHTTCANRAPRWRVRLSYVWVVVMPSRLSGVRAVRKWRTAEIGHDKRHAVRNTSRRHCMSPLRQTRPCSPATRTPAITPRRLWLLIPKPNDLGRRARTRAR